MKIRLLLAGFTVFLLLFTSISRASQADDTTIVIGSNTAGPTDFIRQLSLTASNTTFISSIQFTIAAKPGSVTRLFSQTYSASYLTSRGYLQTTGKIFLPVFGLYASFTNGVTLTFRFFDGSSKQVSTTITTGTFHDPCGLSTPTRLLARTGSKKLSYDYMLVRGACGEANGISPVILDSDGAVRWICPFPAEGVLNASAGFFDHAVYVTRDSKLYRVELDGTVTFLKDYASSGVVNFHHQIDPGRTGMMLDADTTSFYETVNFEVNAAGKILQTFDLAKIISGAMVAGGDNPSQFVFPTPTDWWHNNSTTYRLSDNSQIISSRENLVIALDYDTKAIKWILGDPSKKWFQDFPSLNQFALTLTPGSLPPIGQHSVSFTRDDDLLLMDNGRNSFVQMPAGTNRTYSSPRKYELDLTAKSAKEVWNFEQNQSINSPFCGSTYEDAPLNYLIDFAIIGNATAQIIGLEPSGNRVFQYSYPTMACDTAYNSLPFHAEQLSISNAGPVLNLSTRGTVSSGDKVLIGGFIVNGFEPKNIVLRAIGPSLTAKGVTGALANPVLTVYNSAGKIVAQNDNWQDDARAGEIQSQKLAPENDSEAATLQRLAPGSYTVIISSADQSSGIALVEAYDLSPNSNSTLANLSTRGFIGTDDNVLISGFIVGDRRRATVAIRALGPSLSAAGVADPLSDPFLLIVDSQGNLVGSNNNWEEDENAALLRRYQLAPADPAEAATLTSLAPGSYTVVVEGASGETGTGLVEVYNLP